MSEQQESQGRILVINAEEAVTEPLTVYFAQIGYEMFVAKTAQAGLQQAARHRPQIVLLSPTLDDMDGVDVFNHLRSAPLTSHIPVMFLANRREALRHHELLAAGADDVIMQPFDVEILALRIRNAIKRSRREGLTEPRTGLPTGPLVREKIAAIEDEHDWCRIDLTIEELDVFREGHDFMAANEVLRFAANEICEIVAEMGDEDDFVGHTSETHFIVLVDRSIGHAVRDTIDNYLNEGLHQFHTFMEREQGYVLIEDDFGKMTQHPLMFPNIRLEDGVKGEHDHVAM